VTRCMRRPQNHLGAESTSALARARPRVLADGRLPLSRSVRIRAGELARREPAPDGDQLGKHAGARSPISLVAVDAGVLRR
jgi:hypothetical protein